MIRACPACESGNHVAILTLAALPVSIHVPSASREEAIDVDRDTLELVKCRDCGLLFNQAFSAELVRYAPGYENALNHSATYRAFANRQATELVEDFGVRRRDVVEIGCGNGFFLDAVCAHGNNRGYGIDPSAPDSRNSTTAPDFGEYSIATGTWEDWGTPADAGLVCCRHVLEHVEAPSALLARLSAITGEAGLIYVEVPNARAMLLGGVPWDCIYEHVSYFDADSLQRLVTRCGLGIVRLDTRFREQYLCAVVGGGGPVPQSESDQQGGEVGLEHGFALSCREAMARWTRTLDDLRRGGLDVVLWGAGSKGMVFLNLVDGPGSVSRAVDLNPSKHGKFVPGTGHPIVSPESLCERPPDVVIVSNPAYVDEISRQLADLGLSPSLLRL